MKNSDENNTLKQASCIGDSKVTYLLYTNRYTVHTLSGIKKRKIKLKVNKTKGTKTSQENN